MVTVISRPWVDPPPTPPEHITEDNVQYWSSHAQQLQKTQLSKALKFLRHDCIKYVGDDPVHNTKYTYLCLPLNPEESVKVLGQDFFKKPYIMGYNSRVYRMRKEDGGRWVCDCQGWHAAEANTERTQEDGVQCAHLLTLMLYFKVKGSE